MRSHTPCKSSRAARRRSGLLRMLADSQAGFTIIEVVVASVMLTLMAGAAATALISTADFSGDQRRRSQADEIAQADQERMKGMSIQQINGLNQPRCVSQDGAVTGSAPPCPVGQYAVTSTGKFLSSAGGSSCTSSGTAAAAYVRITTSVTWDANRRPPVTEESLITPVAGGTLLANVQDQTYAPLAGATVTLYPSSDSATTGSEGCVVFGGLKQSGYYVVVQRSGFVDPNGEGFFVTGVNLSGSGTGYPVTNPITLGQAGAVAASFTASNSTLTNQSAPSLSVSHPSRQDPLITTPGAPATSITTLTSLFPFTDSYTAWAGKCPGELPPTVNDRTATTVPPGMTANAVVREPAMNVRVYYPSYNSAQPTVNRIKPDSMKLTYNQAGASTCTESWAPAVRADAATNVNGSLSSPGQPFAGTTTDGSNTYTGSYTVCASYDPPPAGNGGGPQRWGRVTAQANTNFNSATLVPVTIPSSGSTNTGTGACP